MEQSKILLVEDEHFLASLLKNRLQKENFDVTVVPDGDAALNYLKSNKPDLIMLDLILPKKSGFEVLQDLRSDPQKLSDNIPIIIITNLGQPEDVAKGKELGAAGYLIKAQTPIDELVLRIKKFLKK